MSKVSRPKNEKKSTVKGPTKFERWPLNLQSNALPLSYEPITYYKCLKGIIKAIYTFNPKEILKNILLWFLLNFL